MKQVILLAGESKRQTKEFLSLISHANMLINYDMKHMKDVGFNFRPGFVTESNAVNLARISGQMAIAIHLHINTEAPIQTFATYEHDEDTAQLIKNILDTLEGDNERSCKYVCELVMGFPQKMITEKNFPPFIKVRTVMDGDLINVPFETLFGSKTITNESIKLKGSDILYDHIFIPKNNNPHRIAIGAYDLQERYTRGCLGITLIKLKNEIAGLDLL